MPKPYPPDFRREVISAARSSDASLRQIASNYGISDTCLKRWLTIADREDRIRQSSPDPDAEQNAVLRDARKRIRELEQEVEVMRRAVVYLSQRMGSS
ncbi:transposase [Gordonia sp. zg691]|uniref:Transposase n=1 Tax=Gordonia jinghuaiqii TaxID=2758710 RepID=A0A7D7QWZ5_9ACTN|nr:transposase [Gordonia jinghuaiqii]MBD0860624.1 transposase [Gordonia jinghuaiqii]MCR5978110.1 transposase [Gordonia jinghuaiqii]QMT01429.1 transposase [Gordonia jinghuaiqii]